MRGELFGVGRDRLASRAADGIGHDLRIAQAALRCRGEVDIRAAVVSAGQFANRLIRNLTHQHGGGARGCGERTQEATRRLGGVLRSKHDNQGGAGRHRPDCGESGRPVGVDELGVHRRHRIRHRGQERGPIDAADASACGAIEQHQMDVVTGPIGQCAQQERRLQCGIQTRTIADSCRRGASGVDQNHHVPVAFGSPCAQHRRTGPGRGAPVDRTDIVAAHVLTQRVKLGALPPDLDRGVPIEFAQACQT